MRLTRNKLRRMILREMRAQGGQDMPALRSAPGEQGQPHRTQLTPDQLMRVDAIVTDMQDLFDLKNMESVVIEAEVMNYEWVQDDPALWHPVIDKLEELRLGGMNSQ